MREAFTVLGAAACLLVTLTGEGNFTGEAGFICFWRKRVVATGIACIILAGTPLLHPRRGIQPLNAVDGFRFLTGA